MCIGTLCLYHLHIVHVYIFVWNLIFTISNFEKVQDYTVKWINGEEKFSLTHKPEREEEPL